MSVYLGLDCGGSSTRAFAIDQAGTVLFRGSAGAANILTTPESRLVRNLNTAVRDCPSPTFVCGCFAGLVNDESRDRAESFLSALFPAASVKAAPDYAAAFHACQPGTDLCIIAGTGSLICSEIDGAMVKSGGRGYILGDFGSGFQYGRDAILAFLDDPGEASSALSAAITKEFEATDEASIVSKIYRSGTPAMVIGKLVKALGTDAAEKRSYALESLRTNTAMLVKTTAAHIAAYLCRPTVNICLAGGVWKASGVFQAEFESQLQRALPDRAFNVSRIQRPPSEGAAQMAMEMFVRAGK